MRRLIACLAWLVVIVPVRVVWSPAAGAIVDGSEDVEVLAAFAHDWPAHGRDGFPDLRWVADMAVDRFDNVYISDRRGHRLFKLTPDGDFSVLLGGNGIGRASDQLRVPRGVAVDRRGNVFVADAGNHRVQRIAPDGSVTTVVERWNWSPNDVAVDHRGTLYVSAGWDGLFEVTDDGRATRIAGGRLLGHAVDQLDSPSGLALDGAGNLYIAESRYGRVHKLDLATGVMTAVPGEVFGLHSPRQIAIDAAGDIYVDELNYVIKLSSNGTKTPLFSTRSGYSPPGGIAFDSHGSLYFANDTSTEIRRLTNTTPAGHREITGPFARTSGIEGSIARLYRAVLDRQPDLAGYDYWVDRAAEGADLCEIAYHFLAASEYLRSRSSLTNAAFVDRLYLEVMGRPAEQAGAAYWTGLLDIGVDRAIVLLEFSESVEFKRHTRTN